MEDLVRRIAEWGLTDPAWYDVLDAVKAGEITLPDLLLASSEDRLEHLKVMMRDPLLSAAVEQYLQTDPGYDTENGLAILQEMAQREFGEKPRFGVLRTGKNITLLCARAKKEGGRDRTTGEFGARLSHNSVHRSIHLATSKLLRFHLGNAERDRIFADVDFTRENDTRDVWLTADEVRDLLDACESWFRPFVMVALTTSADRSPLIKMKCRDVQMVYNQKAERYSGILYLPDSKTDDRPRSVSIVDAVCRELLPMLQGKKPEDHVFDGPPDEDRAMKGLRPEPITRHQVRYWFDKAREAAGLEHARFKDLRRTWAVTADMAGLNLGQMRAGMGHGLEETTVRYTNRQVTLELDDAERVAKQMGIGVAREERQAASGGNRGN